MAESIEKKRYFKGRKIFEWPSEVKETDRRTIEMDRKYTEEVKEKNKSEKKELSDIAKRYAFEELLVSEELERPGIEPHFPTILTIPDRYPTNLGLIKEFVPQNRLEEAIMELCFHERLHSIGESVKHRDSTGVKINKEKKQLLEKLEKFEKMLNQTEKTAGDKELIRLIIEGQKLAEEKAAMSEKISNYEEGQEIITDRQLMKETPNIDALASLMLIDPMFSHGVVGARLIVSRVRKLKKEGLFGSSAKEFIEQSIMRYPCAHIKISEKLIKKYIEIGGEILEKFDAWEKENIKKTNKN